MVNELTAHGPGVPPGALREEWRIEGPDRYRWVLLGAGGQPSMDGTWVRRWGR